MAAKCLERERTVKDTLSPEGAAKSMEKMAKEFKSQSLVGPFPNRHKLMLAIQEEIRKHPGLHNFDIMPFADLIIASP